MPIYRGLACGPLAVSIVLFSSCKGPVNRERTLHVMQLAELSIIKGMPLESKEIASCEGEVSSLEVVKATVDGVSVGEEGTSVANAVSLDGGQ